MHIPKAPLFRDPIFDGAADPTIIWNREDAYIFYFTHPDRKEGEQSAYKNRRSSIQVAKLELVDDVLVCNRNVPFHLDL